MEYVSLTGETNGMDTTVISEIAHYSAHELKYQIPLQLSLCWT